MHKRKYADDDDSDRLRRKIRKMEKKLKKRKRQLRRSNSSSSSEYSATRSLPISSTNEDVEDLLPVYELINEDLATEPTTSAVEQALQDITNSSNNPVSDVPMPADENTGTDDGPANDDVALDEEILTFLGDAPTKDKKYGPKIQSEIASRWEHVAISGISKENKKEILEKYITPENCKCIDPPALNPEIKAALSESLLKKDSAIQNKQKQIATAVSCIGQAVKRALSQDKKDAEIIKLLIDAGRIVSDIQHTESMLRRGFVSSYIKKDIKDHLNDTQIDRFLFGEKLADTLRAAKFINKSGSEIRASTSLKQTQKNKPSNRALNFRGPATTSRPPLAGRRLEHAAPAPAAPLLLPPPPPPPRRRAPPPPAQQRTQQRPRAPRR